MGKGTKRSASASERQPRAAARRVVKKRTNLTLDPEAVAVGERYGKRHGTSVSQLVNGFLHALGRGSDDYVSVASELAPPVRRLYGLAAGWTTAREAHRDYLREKYGSRR